MEQTAVTARRNIAKGAGGYRDIYNISRTTQSLAYERHATIVWVLNGAMLAFFEYSNLVWWEGRRDHGIWRLLRVPGCDTWCGCGKVWRAERTVAVPLARCWACCSCLHAVLTVRGRIWRSGDGDFTGSYGHTPTMISLTWTGKNANLATGSQKTKSAAYGLDETVRACTSTGRQRRLCEWPHQ